MYFCFGLSLSNSYNGDVLYISSHEAILIPSVCGSAPGARPRPRGPAPPQGPGPAYWVLLLMFNTEPTCSWIMKHFFLCSSNGL